MGGIRYKGQIFSGAASYSSADDVSYDNSDSGLAADNVQDAVDELNSNIPQSEIINVIPIDYGKTSSPNIMRVGRLVSGCVAIEIKNQLPAGVWNRVGYITTLPSRNITVPFSNGYNGSYGGLLRINTSGNIHVFPTPNTLEADVSSVVANVSFLV